MTSTKSLFTPYGSKQPSLSNSSSKRTPLNSFMKRKRSTYSQDYSHLAKIYCSVHNSLITIICTDPACETNCLLCEKCDLSPHRNHTLSNMKTFLHSSMNSLEQQLKKHDEMTLNKLKDIEKFTNEAETKLLAFVRCINQQKVEISRDSERIRSLLQSLLDKWDQNVFRMKQTLEENLVDLRNMILTIKDFSHEESSLMHLILNETSLDRLFDDLVSLNLNNDAAKIQSVFKHLIKVASQKFTCETQKDYEQQKLVQINLEGMLELLDHIRIKVQNPPRYKYFQNATTKFDEFLKKITELNDECKDVSKLLLMSQVDLNLRLNALGNNISKISHDSCSVVIEEPNCKLSHVEFQSTFKTKHRKGITCVTSYGPNHFVTGSFDERLIIWDLKTFEEVKDPKPINLRKVPSSLLTLLDEESKAKQLIVGSKDGFVAILDRNFKLMQILKEHESQVSSFAYLPHLKVLISGAYDATIAIYASNDGKFMTLKKLEETEAINCLEIYDELRFLTGSDDCMIKFWEVNNTNSINMLGTYENKLSVVLLPKNIINDYSVNVMKVSRVNKRVIAVNSFNKINLWDIDTGNLLNKLRIHRENITKFGLIELSSLKSIKNNHKKQKNYLSWDPNKPFINNEEITKLNLISKDAIYLLSFGEDHKIALTDMNNCKKIYENISFQGDVDLRDSNISLMFFADEREEKIYFLNCINRESSMNLWTIHFETKEKEQQ